MGCSASKDAAYSPAPAPQIIEEIEAEDEGVLGVSLSAILKLSAPVSRDTTTYDFAENIVKPATLQRKCSYLELLASQDKEQPSLFISHRWGAPFLSTVQAVCRHAGVDSADDEKAKTTFVWMDVFCVNQHTGKQSSSSLAAVAALKGTVSACQQMLICLDAEGEIFSRLWCLFELLTAAQTIGSPRTRILAEAVDQAALSDAYHSIDLETAATTQEVDRSNILDKVNSSPPGLGGAGDIIKRALLESTAAEAETAEAACDQWPLTAAAALVKHSHMLELIGNLAHAEVLAKRALEHREAALGKQHADVAMSLTDVAHLLQEQGNHVEAEGLLRRALAIQESTLGKENVETAITTEQLAFSLMFQQRYTEAERLYRDLLERFTSNGLEEHVAVAVVLSGLGQALGHEGRWAHETEDLQRRALAIRTKLLGAEHPDTLDSLAAVAEVMYQQRRLPEAEVMSRKALALRKKVLGTTHLSVAESLVGLADVLEANTQYEESEKLFREAYDIRRRLLGPVHADLANSLMDIAKVLECEWRDDEAEPYYRDALEMREILFGELHLDVAASQIALADLLVGMDRFEEAEKLYRKALRVREKLVGRSHPDWADALSNLEAVLKSQAKREEAEALRHQPPTPMSKKLSRKLSSSSIGSRPSSRPGSTSSFGSTRNIFRDSRWGSNIMSASGDLSMWVIREDDLPKSTDGGWKLM